MSETNDSSSSLSYECDRKYNDNLCHNDNAPKEFEYEIRINDEHNNEQRDFEHKDGNSVNAPENIDILQFDEIEVPVKVEYDDVELDKHPPNAIKPDPQQFSRSWCLFCGVKFLCNDHFEIHKQTWHPKCEICKTQYLDIRGLRAHQKREHSFHECPSCQEGFVYASDLLKHLQSLKDFALFKCDKEDCIEQEFHTMGECWKHRYEENITEKCIICAQGFENQETLHEHMKDVHQLQVDISGKMTRVTSSWTKENAYNPNVNFEIPHPKGEQNPVQNNIPPSFASVSKQNEQFASNCNKPNCSYCAIFLGEDDLHSPHKKAKIEDVKENTDISKDSPFNESHSATEPTTMFIPSNSKDPTKDLHKSKSSKWHCLHCNVTFIKREHFKLHNQFYHPKCKTCKVKFLDRRFLQSHMKKEHSLHKCQACGQNFVYEDELMEHLEDIKKSNPEIIKCQHKTCGLIFHSITERYKHTSMEHMEKNCIICGQGVMTVGLRRHLRHVHKVETVHVNGKRTHKAPSNNRLDSKAEQYVQNAEPSNAKELTANKISPSVSHQNSQRVFHCAEPDCRYCKLFLGAENISASSIGDMPEKESTDIAQPDKRNSSLPVTEPVSLKPSNTADDYHSSENIKQAIKANNAPTGTMDQQKLAKWYCNYCSIRFVIRRHLELHNVSIHPRCLCCGVHFQDMNSLQSHQKQVHSLQECPACQQNFMSIHLLLKHLESVKDSSLFKCDHKDCGVVFHTMRELDIHNSFEHMYLNCVLCGPYATTTENTTVLERHMKEAHKVVIVNWEMQTVLPIHIQQSLSAKEAKPAKSASPSLTHDKPPLSFKPLTMQHVQNVSETIETPRNTKAPMPLDLHLGEEGNHAIASRNMHENTRENTHIAQLDENETQSTLKKPDHTKQQYINKEFKIQNMFSTRTNGTPSWVRESQKTSKWYCRYCNIRFVLLSHLELHNNSNHLLCHICSESYHNLNLACIKDMKTLRLHYKTVHSFHHECHACREIFSSIGSLSKHLESVEDSSLFMCDQKNCGQIFHTKDELDTHNYVEHIAFKCVLCGPFDRNKMNETTIERHLKLEHQAEIEWMGIVTIIRPARPEGIISISGKTQHDKQKNGLSGGHLNIKEILRTKIASSLAVKYDRFTQSSTPITTQSVQNVFDTGAKITEVPIPQVLNSGVGSINWMPENTITCSKCLSMFRNKVQWERHIWKCKK